MAMDAPQLLEVETKAPIFWWDISDLRPVLDLAEQAIHELRVSHPQSPQSNVKSVYMSPWKSHLLNPKFQPLCQEAIERAKLVSKTYWNTDVQALNQDFMIADCWGVIYEQTDQTANHSHYPSDFACVIYLEADEHCAPIVFESRLQVQPRRNTMIMFPGYLMHYVPQNHARRMIVAMNLNKIPAFGQA